MKLVIKTKKIIQPDLF